LSTDSAFVKKNIISPITGEFELTANCNFKCSFCYLNHEIHNKELDTDTWKKIFDDAIKNGLLFANLTGGEVFLRKDFSELYEYLFDQGVKLTLFSNSSLITDEHIELLKVKKPQYIAITLYGYDDESFSYITRNRFSFSNVKQNIHKLLSNNVKVILRTIPIKFIYNHLDELIDFAKSLGQNLYYFSYVSDTGNQNQDFQRLSPSELLDFESRIRKAFGYKKSPIRFEHDYKSCTTLKTSYFINHLGEMAPCPMAFQPSKSVVDNDFMLTFKELSEQFIELEKQNPCYGCEYISTCSSCYARRLNEKGNEYCSPYLKEMAKAREKHYKICNLDIVLKHRYDDFFLGNLEKYETKETDISNKHLIRTHFVDSIELPASRPNYTYSTRQVYKTPDKETIYATNKDGKVLEKFVKANDYTKYDIFFSKDKDEVLSEKEYIFTGIAFMDIVSQEGYIPIHGSAVNYQNETLIFSAPSGTGKSTLANHWKAVFSESDIFNDDKPIIHPVDNVFSVSGTPWSGKDIINKNITLPLKAIIFLKQGQQNKIYKLNEKEKLTHIFRNINRPKEEETIDKMIDNINQLVKETDMYMAEIINDTSAAIMIHNHIYGGSHED